MRRMLGSLSFVVISASVAACSDPMTPEQDALRHVGVFASTVLGSNTTVSPSNNTVNNGAIGWNNTGISVPPLTWVRVQISGDIAIGPNPAYLAYLAANNFPVVQLEFWGQVARPIGRMGSPDLRASARLEGSFGTYGLPLGLPPGDSSKLQAYLLHPAGGTIAVARNGVGGGVQCVDGSCTYVGYYSLDGATTVTVEEMEPATVQPDKRLFGPGDTVRFTVVPNGTPIDNTVWYFMAGDTLEMALNPSGWALPCPNEGTLTCKIVPSGSGRMHVRTYGPQQNAYQWTHSEVVRYSPTPVQPLSISCPATVQRGQSADCTASVSPAPDSIVWHFAPDALGLPANNASGSSWGGVWAHGGEMHAAAYHRDVVQRDSAHVDVTARAWTWKAHQTSSSSLADSCFLFWAGYAGSWTKGLTAQSDCSNNAIAPHESDGAVMEEATGPNAGAWFVRDHTYHVELANGVHPDLRPTGRRWLVNEPGGACDGAEKNMYEYNHTCVAGSMFDQWVTSVQAHEDEHIRLALQGADLIADMNLPSDIEDLVMNSDSSLRAEVSEQWRSHDTDIFNYSLILHMKPWVAIGPAWFYEPMTEMFVNVIAEMQL